MGITASGATPVFYGHRNAPGQNRPNNVDLAPGLIWGGWGILDQRVGYNNTRLGAIGWYGVGEITVLDVAPSTASTSNIAAAQVPVAATPLTLRSSTGAGVTVLASATQVWASGNTVPANALALDGASGLLQPGLSLPVIATGTTRLSFYDPSKMLARAVQITSVGDDHLATATIAGFDVYGYAMTETLTLTSGSSTAVTGKKAWKYITSITPAGTLSGSNVSVGTTDTFGIPLRADYAAYLGAWWNGAEATGGGSSPDLLILPTQLLDFASTTTLNIDAPFDGTIASANFRVVKPATTAAKAATLTAHANGTNVTGGVIALTSANCTPAGAQVAGSAITAGNAFAVGQTIGVKVTSVTPFIEGDGFIELTISNTSGAGGAYTGADATTATATTGDVRGTYVVPDASDGTKRLQIFLNPSTANMLSASPSAGLFGVTQA